VLWQDFFTIDEHRKARRAFVLDFGANLPYSFSSGKFFGVRRQNISNIDLEAAVDQDLFINRVNRL
jgi:hypothetical protein